MRVVNIVIYYIFTLPYKTTFAQSLLYRKKDVSSQKYIYIFLRIETSREEFHVVQQLLVGEGRVVTSLAPYLLLAVKKNKTQA